MPAQQELLAPKPCLHVLKHFFLSTDFGVLCVNLIQTRVTKDEKASVEEMPQ